MKKFLILSMAVIGFASAQAQKNKASVKAPGAAKEAFVKAHPNVAGIWEKEDGNYEVTFKEGGKSMSSVITAKGDVLETETVMPLTELPTPVTANIAQHYKGVKVKEAATIVKADGTTEYEANIKGKDVLFDAAGKVIKSKKEND